MEDQLRSQEIIRIVKSACSGADLCADFPCELGQLLDHSRSLVYNQPPGHEALRTSFLDLSCRMGYSLIDEPLDWTPCYPQITHPILEEPIVSIPDENERVREQKVDDLDDKIANSLNNTVTNLRVENFKLSLAFLACVTHV